MEKKKEDGRFKIGHILKSKKFWIGFISLIVLVAVIFLVTYVVGYEKRQQVAEEIKSQCSRVESVEVSVLKDARDRKRPTYVLKVPADFSEDERNQVEEIVKEHYKKYYYVFYE